MEEFLKLAFKYRAHMQHCGATGIASYQSLAAHIQIVYLRSVSISR